MAVNNEYTGLLDARQSSVQSNVHAADPAVTRSLVTPSTAVPRCAAPRSLYVRLLKRPLDAIVASILLVMLSPVFLAAAVLVLRDSPGPIIFRQRRIGRHGESFVLYKFRTMSWNPDREFEFVRDVDGTLRHKVRNDSRVTRVGRTLRRCSIDELPQLWNIVKGDMSLIGPRPELPQIVERYSSWQHDRHLLRPGLTGWWQVSGRSDRPMHEHTELDIHYVENASFAMDVKIAFRTIRVVLRGLGAF